MSDPAGPDIFLPLFEEERKEREDRAEKGRSHCALRYMFREATGVPSDANRYSFDLFMREEDSWADLIACRSTERESDDGAPRPRYTPISIDIDEDIMSMLRAVSRARNQVKRAAASIGKDVRLVPVDDEFAFIVYRRGKPLGKVVYAYSFFDAGEFDYLNVATKEYIEWKVKKLAGGPRGPETKSF